MKNFKIRLFILIVLSLLLVSCSNDQPKKTYKVGILSGLDFFANTADGFKEQMAELGYIEGQDIIYDFQKTNFDPVKEKQILDKFVNDKVDLILVFPTEASLEAKEAAKSAQIPVVFANANVEGVDLIESIRAPGGHITGVRFPGPDLAIKRFEIMIEILPKAKRILVPYQKGYPIIDSQMQILRPAAKDSGITIIEVPASNADELKTELEKIKTEQFDAVLFIADPLTVTPNAFLEIGKFAREKNIPIGGALVQIDGYETLFGVSTENVAVGKQAAVLADKILNGIPAGTIPVVSAESFMQINYKEAEKQDIQISESLLIRAAKIIR